jgi:hypothetical protein
MSRRCSGVMYLASSWCSRLVMSKATFSGIGDECIMASLSPRNVKRWFHFSLRGNHPRMSGYMHRRGRRWGGTWSCSKRRPQFRHTSRPGIRSESIGPAGGIQHYLGRPFGRASSRQTFVVTFHSLVNENQPDNHRLNLRATMRLRGRRRRRICFRIRREPLRRHLFFGHLQLRRHRILFPDDHGVHAFSVPEMTFRAIRALTQTPLRGDFPIVQPNRRTH